MRPTRKPRIYTHADMKKIWKKTREHKLKYGTTKEWWDIVRAVLQQNAANDLWNRCNGVKK